MPYRVEAVLPGYLYSTLRTEAPATAHTLEEVNIGVHPRRSYVAVQDIRHAPNSCIVNNPKANRPQKNRQATENRCAPTTSRHPRTAPAQKAAETDAKLVAENDYWKVYSITTYEASEK